MINNIQDLKVQKEFVDNAVVVRLQGAISSFTYEKFMKEIQLALKKGDGVILDMEDIILISSKGITALKEISDISYKQGKKIILLNLSESARQVLDMMQLKKMFNIAPNEELAAKMVEK
ncbi:MAG: STAS domain-containing protein [Leptospiraceae bacterium]|nr:STAS domain-containing protein [Leptospiraceae bacterium]MCP5501253.1 STAS domain-containing protein [Leptospiraceae bacterium]